MFFYSYDDLFSHLALKLSGISTSVIDMHTIKPLDTRPVSYTHLDVYKRQMYTGGTNYIVKIDGQTLVNNYEYTTLKLSLIHI